MQLFLIFIISSYTKKDELKERCGQVVSIDIDKRMLSLYFQMIENNIITDITELVSYDHPDLSWYKDESVTWVPGVGWVGVEYPGFKNNPKVSKPSFYDAVGYVVEVTSHEPDSKEGIQCTHACMYIHMSDISLYILSF